MRSFVVSLRANGFDNDIQTWSFPATRGINNENNIAEGRMHPNLDRRKRESIGIVRSVDDLKEG